MLLPPQFKDEALKTLGPPIRKEEEKKPVEVYIGNGVWRVNGKLETRIPENEEADQHPWYQINPQSYQVSEIDIPLPEFGCGRPPKSGEYLFRTKGYLNWTKPMTYNHKESRIGHVPFSDDEFKNLEWVYETR